MSTAENVGLVPNLRIRVETTDTRYVSDLIRKMHVVTRDENGSGHKQQPVLWLMLDGPSGGTWFLTLRVAADEQFTADVTASMRVYVARFDGAGPRHAQRVVSVEEWHD